MAILDRWNRLHSIIRTELLWNIYSQEHVALMLHREDCEACQQGLPLEVEPEADRRET